MDLVDMELNRKGGRRGNALLPIKQSRLQRELRQGLKVELKHTSKKGSWKGWVT